MRIEKTALDAQNRCVYLLYKEKGCITVQVKPDNYKTAFLANGQLIYIRNKELVLD